MAASKIPIEQQCVYCNSAPVSHASHFFSTSIELFFSDLARPFHLTMGVPAFLDRFAVWLLEVLGECLALVHVISYKADITTATTERMRSALDEAQKRHIPVEVMHVFGKPIEVFRALLQKKGSGHYEWFYFESLPLRSKRDPKAATWVDDKRLFNKHFTAAGLPVAKSIVVRSLSGARAAFAKLGAPVITKPRSGSRARHTTVHIHTEADLIAGYKKAKQLCYYVLVEQCIPGNVYRATCVGGKVIGILELVKPRMIADGEKTLAELLTYHNAHKKLASLTDVRDNAWFRESIAHQGFTIDSVPSKGTEILFMEHSERYNGGYFVDVTDDVPSENIALIEKGAQFCGLDLIGFDIMSRDLTKSVTVEPLTFIEGNTLPFVEIHLAPYEGKPRDPLAALWDLWN